MQNNLLQAALKKEGLKSRWGAGGKKNGKSAG